MAEPAGTAGSGLPTESPVTSDDIAAFANAEAASSPAPSTDVETPAPAIEGTAPSGVPVPVDTAGPLPYERHKAILEHARTEASAKAEREWKARFGWAERYQPEQVEMSSRLYQWLNTDPRQFMSWLRTQVGEEAPGRAPAPTGPPEPDLRAEDGTPVYSAPRLQQLLEWQQQKFQQSLEPLQRKQAQADERDTLSRTAREAKASATSLLTQARAQWPAFTDLEPSILRSMRDNPTLSFHDAYIHAFATEGTPKLRAQWTTEYQGTLARKADASTAPPGRPSGTPKKYSEMSTEDVVKQEWESLTRKR